MDTLETDRMTRAGTLGSRDAPSAGAAGVAIAVATAPIAGIRGLGTLLDSAERAGFDRLLIPCPVVTRAGLLADVSQVAQWFGMPLEEVVGALSQTLPGHSVGVIAEVPVGAVASGSALHLGSPDVYRAADRDGVLDPRRPLDLDRAPLDTSNPQAVAAHAAMLGGLLGGLRSAGLQGAMLTGLDRLDRTGLRVVLHAIRAAAPEAVLLGDMRGVPAEHVGGDLAGLFDAVVGSSAWWDWQEHWLFEELARLAPVAPVLLPAPNGAHGAELSRAAGLACAMGAGWLAAIGAAEASAVAGDDIAALASLNQDLRRTIDLVGGSSVPLAISSPRSTVMATVRADRPDHRRAEHVSLVVVNAGTQGSCVVDPAPFLSAVDLTHDGFTAADGSGHSLVPGSRIDISAGGFRVFDATRSRQAAPAPIVAQSAASAAQSLPRLGLENPTPAVDGGRFAVKATAGQVITVEVDVIGDGHDKLSAAVQWRGPRSDEWSETRLEPLGNDRWVGRFPLASIGLHHWRAVAWCDHFATWRDEFGKKFNAGIDVALELREGVLLVEETLAGVAAGAPVLSALRQAGYDADRLREVLISAETFAVMQAADPRPNLSETADIPVEAERVGASFASWYEVFPRSMSDDMGRHGTFADVERHLPRIRAMGFDVLYFPPIHPIGRINRKGPNNTLTPGPQDPGSPYAVGTTEGGHDAIHPELGTFEDFARLLGAAAEQGLEIAIDFAIQCAPDHPWLRDHKDWFHWRPDGTVKYAENPPKKYQDIVNVDFYTKGAVPTLWVELANVVLFWCGHGVRMFRVDNPHTKAFPFWEWMIREVRDLYPDAMFLAEAFTRPKIMARLAKIGFSQSYTYFTWRNTRAEIEEYLTELNESPLSEIFRPHFFVNTPDINPFFLQGGDRPSFLIRAALAATLSGLWGVYNGFELCEGTRLAEGKEEYLDSEKFQQRAWDWDRPGNIVPEITRLNAIRRENPALHSHLGLTFLPSGNSQVVFFEKATPDRSNVLWIAISFDPRNGQSSPIELPLWRQTLADTASVELEDIVFGNRFQLTGKHQSVFLPPESPYAIWRLVRTA